MWTVGLTVEKELRFQISPAQWGRGLKLPSIEWTLYSFSRFPVVVRKFKYSPPRLGWLLWGDVIIIQVKMKIIHRFSIVINLLDLLDLKKMFFYINQCWKVVSRDLLRNRRTFSNACSLKFIHVIWIHSLLNNCFSDPASQKTHFGAINFRWLYADN